MGAPNRNSAKFSSAFLVNTKSGHHPRLPFMTKESIMSVRGRDNLFAEFGLSFTVSWRFVVH
jgi:hypothetical protein